MFECVIISLYPDDRFVLKQISRLEFQSFKEFAPHYFKYIEQANTEQVTTYSLLVVLLGSFSYRPIAYDVN